MGDFAFLDSVASADRDLFGIPNTSSFCLFELLGWTREKTFMTQIDSAKTEEAQRRFRLVVGAFARLMGAFGLLADMGMEAPPDCDECFNMPVTGALCGIACCEDPDCKKVRNWLNNQTNAFIKSRSNILSLAIPDEISAFTRRRPLSIGVAFMETVGWDLAEAIDTRISS